MRYEPRKILGAVKQNKAILFPKFCFAPKLQIYIWILASLKRSFNLEAKWKFSLPSSWSSS